MRDTKAMAGETAAPSNGGDGALTVYELSCGTRERILAVGGELKSSVCMFTNRTALLSEPIGDLTDPGAYRRYVELVAKWESEREFYPDVVAHDMHPLYMSTRFAQSTRLPTIAVQHHHAHVVSVMAEQGVEGPAVGICCDGVGYGTDGAAWGCEILACDASGFERLAHLNYFPLIGGDAAAVQTWRPAAAMMAQAFSDDWMDAHPAIFGRIDRRELVTCQRVMKSGLNAPMTSSLGRVFDGVSFLLGLCDRNEREAQAAIALEAAAAGDDVEPYPYETTTTSGSFKMSIAPMVRAIVDDLRAKTDVGVMSARFHETMARMLSASALMAGSLTGASTVVLSGGCFANKRLSSRLIERLRMRDTRVVTPGRVSCGDAGLALGQAVIAAAMRERSGACA
jgi:hydrogenase maturation protein HypF